MMKKEDGRMEGCMEEEREEVCVGWGGRVRKGRRVETGEV